MSFGLALKVLATSHDKQRKPVTLSFTGQGKRRVSVGYILGSAALENQLSP